jgi:nitrogen PTS system EIIA component
MIHLSDYIDERLVLFLDTSNKEEVLKKLVERAVMMKELPAEERFYQAILDREKLVSTAIGMGVAVPHAKLPVYNDFFIAVGILSKGVEWQAPDDSLVRLVFLIGGPENRQTEYLKILSSLTIALRKEQLRKQLVTADSEQKVAAYLKQISS